MDIQVQSATCQTLIKYLTISDNFLINLHEAIDKPKEKWVDLPCLKEDPVKTPNTALGDRICQNTDIEKIKAQVQSAEKKMDAAQVPIKKKICEQISDLQQTVKLMKAQTELLDTLEQLPQAFEQQLKTNKQIEHNLKFNANKIVKHLKKTQETKEAEELKKIQELKKVEKEKEVEQAKEPDEPKKAEISKEISELNEKIKEAEQACAIAKLQLQKFQNHTELQNAELKIINDNLKKKTTITKKTIIDIEKRRLKNETQKLQTKVTQLEKSLAELMLTPVDRKIIYEICSQTIYALQKTTKESTIVKDILKIVLAVVKCAISIISTILSGGITIPFAATSMLELTDIGIQILETAKNE